jgi:transcriptional regulator with XRE-family HTH domain
MVGEKIREVRQSQGRSLAEVAGKARISVATLSRIETDKQSIDVALLVALARILSVEASDIIGSSEGAGPDPLAQRIASLDPRKRAELWRDLAAERRTQRSRSRNAMNMSQQVDELLAQIDFLREELEAVRLRVKKPR